MKRIWIAVFVMLAAAAVYASTAITLDPSEMKNGETKKLVDGGKTVIVTRTGDALEIRIEGAGDAKKLIITSAGETFRIERDGRTWIMPHGETFQVPGIKSFKFREPARQTLFVCPKDHATLRVPAGKEDETYKCPVDGTTMEKKKGRGFQFFFDDAFDGESI